MPASYGSRCLVYIANAPLLTPISGRHMEPCCRRSGTLAVGKATGQTCYVERFNNTLRQRVSQLVRKTLLFSESLGDHIGAIWYFVHAYNASLLL